MKIIDTLRHPTGDKARASGDRPRLASDDEVAQRALDSMKSADRWLHAAMADADRVFRQGAKPR